MADFVEVPVINLSGAALNWAVAKATGADDLKITDSGSICCVYAMPCGNGCWTAYYEPSSDWAYCGPLLQPNYIELSIGDEEYWARRTCTSKYDDERVSYAGSSMLIAACRAIVAAKLGETVSVPKELLPC